MIRLFIPFSALLVTVQSAYIVGGHYISIEDAPYQVSLQFQNHTGNYTHRCGGSIISQKWVLTAAHCLRTVANNKTFNLKVRAGSTKHASGGEFISVSEVVQHPKYDDDIRSDDYDFGLLRMETSVTLGPNAQVVELPIQNEPVVDNMIGKVSGWGSTGKVGENKWPTDLQAVDVLVYSQKRCREEYATIGLPITDQMLCAGYPEGGRDACVRDSGGPLVANGKLIGVVSKGNDCGLPGYPGIYARVAAARDWIRSVSGV